MIRASAVTLIADAPEAHGIYEVVATPSRTMPCDVQSVGRREAYEAMSHNLHPEWVLVLGDYAEYDGEQRCEFEGKNYRIIRTYVRGDNRIELTIERVTRYDV